MTSKEICELVWSHAEGYAKEVGCIIWDVRFFREGGDWCLKIILDTDPPGGVDINMCEHVNRAMDTKLDELDPIEQSYFLEVSSPGVDRELYRPSDYDKFAGSLVDVKLYKKAADGSKTFTAVLSSRNGEDIVFDRDGEEVTLPMSAIARCNIHFDFNDFNDVND